MLGANLALMFSLSKSLSLIFLYMNDAGKQGSIPLIQFKICVIPLV